MMNVLMCNSNIFIGQFKTTLKTEVYKFIQESNMQMSYTIYLT